jgi:methylated-DNA-[protein]-cysteine S-methyltransferase
VNTQETLYYSTFQTPAGPFSIAVDGKGSIVATAFGGRETLGTRVKGAALVEDGTRTSEARIQVLAWFKGNRRDFSLELSPSGSPFQRKVWAALGRIPYGEKRTYGEIARALGSSPRAVGRANATNPICLIVPCHRVIGADGSLTGYAFGERTKQRLLEFEAA